MEAVALTVIACYRPHEGKDAQLAELVRSHLPTLRNEGLISDDEPVHLLAADGTVLEIFSWKSEQHSRSAEGNDAVQAVWGAIAACADFRQLEQLEEAGRPFAHFQRVTPEEL